MNNETRGCRLMITV